MASRIKRLASAVYNRTLNRRFYWLKRNANGMLPARTYRELYRSVVSLPDLDVVEIGGAAGASSIAIAWAMRDAGMASHLITIEKCEGGSRSDYGDYKSNREVIEANLQQFGVSDTTRLFPYELTLANGDEVKRLIETSQIGALVHDADGRIDRDFILFWEILRPGGLIVVDDFGDGADFKPISPRHPQGGTKKLITSRLLRQFIDWGLVEPTTMRGEMFFGIKPRESSFAAFDVRACEQILDGIRKEHAAFLGVDKIS